MIFLFRKQSPINSNDQVSPSEEFDVSVSSSSTSSRIKLGLLNEQSGSNSNNGRSSFCNNEFNEKSIRQCTPTTASAAMSLYLLRPPLNDKQSINSSAAGANRQSFPRSNHGKRGVISCGDEEDPELKKLRYVLNTGRPSILSRVVLPSKNKNGQSTHDSSITKLIDHPKDDEEDDDDYDKENGGRISDMNHSFSHNRASNPPLFASPNTMSVANALSNMGSFGSAMHYIV